jgi:membrane dipeptidase
VRACADRGILVDLSHLNLRGFWDVAELTGAPLVASHAAAHALCPTARNLTDEQLDAVGASGRLVGVILNAPDLRGQRDGGAIADVVRHAGYIADRIGRAHVALGSDWNGAHPPGGLEHCGRLPALLDALAGAGWDDAGLRAFAYGNWLRVLRDTWGG